MQDFALCRILTEELRILLIRWRFYQNPIELFILYFTDWRRHGQLLAVDLFHFNGHHRRLLRDELNSRCPHRVSGGWRLHEQHVHYRFCGHPLPILLFFFMFIGLSPSCENLACCFLRHWLASFDCLSCTVINRRSLARFSCCCCSGGCHHERLTLNTIPCVLSVLSPFPEAINRILLLEGQWMRLCSIYIYIYIYKLCPLASL